MKEDIQSEKEAWQRVKDLLGKKSIKLGRHWSGNLFDDPKRLSFVLSRYKFAAKMGSKNRRVLELGCSEGIGAPILSEFALSYTGVDMDKDAVNTAKLNWTSDKTTFYEGNFLKTTYGVFDTVVSLDVLEHITAADERLFFDAVYNNLGADGIGIVGTPNVTSARYASRASRAGHVNMFSADKLKQAMQKFFYNVFIFGINDEVVHTGFSPMAHYLVSLGCNKKTNKVPG